MHTHRYCALLPRDIYCFPQPKFTLEGRYFDSYTESSAIAVEEDLEEDKEKVDEELDNRVNGEFRCVLNLPVNAAFTQAIGDWQWTKKQAKQNACLVAVRKLHAVAALDDHLGCLKSNIYFSFIFLNFFFSLVVCKYVLIYIYVFCSDFCNKCKY